MMPSLLRHLHVERKLRAIALASLTLATAIAVSVQATSAREPDRISQVAATDSSARAPKGTRVRVRVLNGTTTRGLAKRVTFVLRDFGYDVVDFDTDVEGRRAVTVIRSHTGHSDWAQRLRRAVGTGDITTSKDSSRYVDFTVVVGSDWKAPAQSFRP
ncbi:MAG: LytR C-terminal domain-containing protein [Gemmatimonadaceae bacterium]|nr:LytR C-terminal domain-containing protein [Gemmatimonadaceae bacterium]